MIKVYIKIIYSTVTAQTQELKRCDVILYRRYMYSTDFWEYTVVLGSVFKQKVFSAAHLHTPQYTVYNMVGRSIAFISDLSTIFTQVLCASINLSPQVVYIGYRLPYCTIQIIQSMCNYACILYSIVNTYSMSKGHIRMPCIITHPCMCISPKAMTHS